MRRRSTNSARSTCRSREAFADAALQLLDEAGVDAGDVRAIGSHGQTVRHRPAASTAIRSPGSSATATSSPNARGIDHRRRFPPPRCRRRRPGRAAGAGASTPRCCTSPDEDRAVLNLGGIANFTLLPRARRRARLRHRPGQRADGCLVRAPHAARRSTPTAHSPRSGARRRRAARAPAATSRGSRCRRRRAAAANSSTSTGCSRSCAGDERAEDVQATLLELTAATVADALRAHAAATRAACWPAAAACTTRVLLQRIAARLPGVRVESTAAHGARSGFRRGDGVRVAGAAKRWPGRPGNLPAVTGARGPRVLGVVYPGLSVTRARQRCSGRASAAGRFRRARRSAPKPGSSRHVFQRRDRLLAARRLAIVEVHVQPGLAARTAPVRAGAAACACMSQPRASASR